MPASVYTVNREMHFSEDERKLLRERLLAGESYQAVSKETKVRISDLVRLKNDIEVEDCAALRERRLSGEEYEVIADETAYSVLEILVFIKQPQDCDELVPPVTEDQPWRQKAVMNSLFRQEGLFFTEMSELLGCHDETARNWVTEHGISRRGTHHTSSKNVRHLQGVLDLLDDDVDPHEVSLTELQKLVQDAKE